MKLFILLLLVTGLCIGVAHSSSNSESSSLAFGEVKDNLATNIDVEPETTPDYEMEELDDESDPEVTEFDDNML